MKSPHSSLKCCKNLANVVQKAWTPAPLPQTIWHGWGISNNSTRLEYIFLKWPLKWQKFRKKKKHMLVISEPWVLAMDDVINSDSPFIHSSASQDDRAERNRKHHKGLWQQCRLCVPVLEGVGNLTEMHCLFVTTLKHQNSDFSLLHYCSKMK